ncbi:hypothetical protein EOM39_05415 [Candidatus Gracilibacteria bacterium]|nr:hypothetical protein [Candidatus Gracilibacteria bacterium]
MKKGLLPKIVAGLALLGILIGILGTAILFILSPKPEVGIDSDSKEIKLSPEQLKQLRELTGTGNDNSGSLDITSGTGGEK